MSLRLAIALFISVCAPSWLAAQSSDAPIRFDEASVKPHDQGDGRMGSGRRGRTYTVTNMPLRPIIAAAYRVQLQSSLLVGGPSWIGGNAPPWSGADRFDIVATLPDNATSQQVPEMLRALLAERFTLVVHTEVRELPAFALVAARGDKRLGPQLRPAAFDCEAAQAAGLAIPPPKHGELPPCTSEVGGPGGGIIGRGQRLSSLARMLTQFAERTVVDRTGLSGGFDFELRFAEATPAPTDAMTGVFTALQEQLGLKLEAIQAPMDVVVIDSVERPTPD